MVIPENVIISLKFSTMTPSRPFASFRGLPRLFTPFRALSHLFTPDRGRKNTYWGNFTQPPNETIDAIIANRNEFVEKYNVKKRCPAPLYVYKKLVLNDDCHDHVECYDAGTSYVVVSSPYGTRSAVPAGFVSSDPLYSNDSCTFIATVEKKARRDRSPTRK